MKSDKLLEVIGEAKEPYVLSALNSRNGKKKTQKHLSFNRTALIAAVIAITLLLVGCAVIYVFGLRDLIITQEEFTPPAAPGQETQPAQIRNAISLQGYAGTPGYLANQEWNAFRDAYQMPENEPEIPMEQRLDYLSYGCFFQEEIDKVDEICEKYRLNTLGIAWIEEEIETTFDALGINGLLLQDAPANVQYHQGYYYGDGTFDIPFDLTLTGADSSWEYPLDMRMRYVMKSSFDGVAAYIGPLEHYEEWTYTTAQGVDVLMALSEKNALMIADQTDAFLTVLIRNIRSEDTENGERVLTQEGMEAIAEVIDFKVDPQDVDVAAAQSRYDARAELARQQQEAEKNASPFELESYREYVDYLISKTQDVNSMLYGVDPGNLYYRILDFNEDGIMDFCWGVGGEKFSEIMTLENGKIKLLYNQGIDSYLCENQILEQSYDREEDSTVFYRYINIENGAFDALCHLQFERDTGIWQKAVYDDRGISWEDITETEAMTIIQSYKRLDLDMKPITEFETQ